MVFLSHKEESRKNWTFDSVSGNGRPNREDLQLGAILRIADAVEAMSKSYVGLLADVKYFKERKEEACLDNRRMARSIIGLRSYIKRLKNKKK